MALLTQHSWPGNVRELENVLERIVVEAQHEAIQPADLPSEILPAARGRRLRARTPPEYC